MTEIRLAISYGALHALVSGDELAFQLDPEVVVTLRMDDEAMKIFAEQFQAFVLRHAPTDPHTH